MDKNKTNILIPLYIIATCLVIITVLIILNTIRGGNILGGAYSGVVQWSENNIKISRDKIRTAYVRALEREGFPNQVISAKMNEFQVSYQEEQEEKGLKKLFRETRKCCADENWICCAQLIVWEAMGFNVWD